ncbi:MAG: hypothetical protein KDD11_07995 [Acidobacteria bacterium]|nr:hypothetical protein [Acidobacteriota bacterium]
MAKASRSLTTRDTGQHELRPLFERALTRVRDDVLDNPYIDEALRVLPAGGHRSAIGCLWNAVVDDLRNKILHRSVELFNKSVNLPREIKRYEDFQDHVTDEQLIDGAYKIGVIGWEAAKVLRHAKETRHIFDGHPRSSEPSAIKVLSMFEDCVKYVLAEPYPPQIIDIDEYLALMNTPDFDRNEFGIANALAEIPEVYKAELINRLFTVYCLENTSSVLRSNIEFVAPILWKVLPKQLKNQVAHRVDQEISKGHTARTQNALGFVNVVNGNIYLTNTARVHTVGPLVKELKESLDDFATENRCVAALEPYAAVIPPQLLSDYVWALTHTYVGHVGHSMQWSRTDFFANKAAARIPRMFAKFDTNAVEAFINAVKESKLLQRRIEDPAKLERLRSLGNIVLERVGGTFDGIQFLQALVDNEREQEFLDTLR